MNATGSTRKKSTCISSSCRSAILPSQVKLTEDDSKKHYERNKEAFKEPLKIQVEYLTYPYDQFASSAEVSEKKSKSITKTIDSKFHRPKEAKMRYISLAVAPGAERGAEKPRDERTPRAIVKDARRGKDFAQLAKRESNDLHRRQRRRNRLDRRQGQMPPPIEK